MSVPLWRRWVAKECRKVWQAARFVWRAAGQQLRGFQKVRIQSAGLQERKRLLEEQRQGSGQGFMRGLVFRHIQPQAARCCPMVSVIRKSKGASSCGRNRSAGQAVELETFVA